MIINKIMHKIGWKVEGQEEYATPVDLDATFELTYRFLKVGKLILHNGIWSFEYSKEFKSQSRIKPLPDFPDVARVYESEELYPFFALRIPGTGQLKAKGMELLTEKDKSEVEMLIRFGRETIANPFTLLPV